MFKRIVFAAAFAAVVSAFAAPAAAQSAGAYRCTADSTRTVESAGTGTCGCPRWLPAIGQKCPTAAPTAVRQTAAPPPVPAATGNCPWGAHYNAIQCAALTEQYTRQLAAGQTPRLPATVVHQATAPAAVGGCWTKVPVTKAHLAELLSAETNDAAWNAVMCVGKQQFVKQMARLAGVAVPATMSEFGATITGATEQACTVVEAKKLLSVASNGQVTGAFGAKCPDDTTFWIINGNIVWVAGDHSRAVVNKDRILAP